MSTEKNAYSPRKYAECAACIFDDYTLWAKIETPNSNRRAGTEQTVFCWHHFSLAGIAIHISRFGGKSRLPSTTAIAFAIRFFVVAFLWDTFMAFSYYHLRRSETFFSGSFLSIWFGRKGSPSRSHILLNVALLAIRLRGKFFQYFIALYLPQDALVMYTFKRKTVS